ncbi:GNAT family N-acetyltransferase [Dactylosporangium sp. NPDC049742]|uniref:GNAT family N-acetyltransferase n=1 Tax=Dactylosporangium sp. NPDC049742 TaxID=3154737 RepID=UPI0034449EEB
MTRWTPTPWTLRPARAGDATTIAELRAVVLRPDLTRLGRYDPVRVRERLLGSFTPRHTTVIEVAGAVAGCVALRPAAGELWLEHFYLRSDLHGHGIGSAVLRTQLDRADAAGLPVRLNVLQGSAARRLYERHGFTVTASDPIDVYMLRPAGIGSPAATVPPAVTGPDGAGAASTTA